MTQAWSQWEGRVVSGAFRLQKYLSGSDHSGVFLAEHQGHEPQQLAVKLVPADAANAELQLDRWRLAEKLSHPHLIRILQSGRCRLDSMDLIFVVMEYAEENLGQILPDRPLTPAETSEMLDPALDALTYLHGQGLVHGCLQPANIMAIKDQLKLASDSVCKAGESFPGSGKRSVYDPPEKADGRASPAADLWSLGVTLAEVLTQRLPSWNEQDQTDPALPADLPAPFFNIVRGCLLHDPHSRLTIADIVTQLHPAPAAPPPVPSSSPQEPKPVSSPQSSSRRRLIVVGAVLIALLVLGRMLRPPAGRKDASQVTQGQKRQPEKTGGSGDRVIDLNQSAKASRRKPSPASSRAPAPAATTDRVSADSQVVHRVLPDVPQSAQDTIQGTIRVLVRVQVDRSGNVVGSEFDSPGPSKYFARLAMQAAQSWKFAPSGQDDRREFVLRFDFTDSETTAFAARTGQ